MTTNAQAALAAGVAVYGATMARDAAVAQAAFGTKGGYSMAPTAQLSSVYTNAFTYLEWLNARDAEQVEEDKIKSKGTLEERVEKLEESK